MVQRSGKGAEAEFCELNTEAREIWEANAEYWDSRIGDGNDFQCELIEPATERLLTLGQGETVLDIACGGGRFARRMAELGANVVAFDFSERFIEIARRRTPREMTGVEYHIIDATDEEQIVALGERRFDKAVCSMALMDMVSIEPLFKALRQVLKAGGWFVFSVMHPCFQPGKICRFTERIDVDGEVRTDTGVKVTYYVTPKAWKGLGILGQPKPQYYFHRPLSALFGVGFRQGFVIDGLEEPAFEASDAAGAGVDWRNLPEIPPVLVVRMRLCAV